jgi:hypothetical protein
VVPVSTNDEDPSSGVPIAVCPAHHGEGVVAWTRQGFVQLLDKEELDDALASLLHQDPPYVMCADRVAEMLLRGHKGPIGWGLLLKRSTGQAVFLDSNDLRLIHQAPHDLVACACARGRMVPFMGLVESLLANER